MADYGVTTKGFVKKRFDSIYEEIQAAIKKETGIDISVNQKSYINVLVNSFADKIEEIWELVELTYYSMFPSSAEGINLDYACQLNGVLRKEGVASKFYIVCTGDDGTLIPAKNTTSSQEYARINTSAKPVYYLVPCNDDYITLSNCSKVQVDVVSQEYEEDYVIFLSGSRYVVKSPSEDDIKGLMVENGVLGENTDTKIDEIEKYKAGHLGMEYDEKTKEWVKEDDYIEKYNTGLKDYYEYVETYDEQVSYWFKHELFTSFLDVLTANENKNYTVNIADVGTDDEVLAIASTSEYVNSEIILNENGEIRLMARSVSTVILFETEDFGEYHFNRGMVDTIANVISGLTSVYNLPIGIYGSLRETDEELRQSYIKKMALRSCSLTTSITAAVLNNCEGVLSCVCFENDLNEESEDHMPPHSIFVVVDGGSREAIAEQIYYYKPAGIYTWDGTWTDEDGTHNTEYAENVEVPTDYNSSIMINFARPQSVYVWLKITLFKDEYAPKPTNLVELVQEAINEFTENLAQGEAVYLQKLVSVIYEKTTGVAYMNILGATTTYEDTDDDNPAPQTYNQRVIDIKQAQKAAFDVEKHLIIDYDDGKGGTPEQIFPVT